MPYERVGAAKVSDHWVRHAGMLDAIVAAKKRGASERDLQAAAVQHRKAQWRLDFVAAENSMGFHAPQELARILGEVIDHARQGQLEAERTVRKK
jgi:nitrite reductase (cytochrome c-552)